MELLCSSIITIWFILVVLDSMHGLRRSRDDDENPYLGVKPQREWLDILTSQLVTEAYRMGVHRDQSQCNPMRIIERELRALEYRLRSLFDGAGNAALQGVADTLIDLDGRLDILFTDYAQFADAVAAGQRSTYREFERALEGFELRKGRIEQALNGCFNQLG